MNKEKEYYTAKEVAAKLQIHWHTLLRYIKAGKLKAVRLGRVYRITQKDLDEFIEQNRAKPKERK